MATVLTIWGATTTVEIPDASGEVNLYRVCAVRPGLDEWAVRLEHQGTEAHYRVAVDALGLWRCSCPDFKYRHRPSKGGGCKHCEAVRAVRKLTTALSGGGDDDGSRQDRPGPGRAVRPGPGEGEAPND